MKEVNKKNFSKKTGKRINGWITSFCDWNCNNFSRTLKHIHKNNKMFLVDDTSKYILYKNANLKAE
jgi:uncharacterized protein YutD